MYALCDEIQIENINTETFKLYWVSLLEMQTNLTLNNM